MAAWKHLVVGAIASVAPDLVLSTFVWRNQWLPESHPLVRLHRFLHSPTGLWVIWCLGWTTHVVADWFSKHRGDE